MKKKDDYIYKYIYKDNEVNLGFYTTRKCWKLMENGKLSYMNDIIEVVIGNKI